MILMCDVSCLTVFFSNSLIFVHLFSSLFIGFCHFSMDFFPFVVVFYFLLVFFTFSLVFFYCSTVFFNFFIGFD